MNTRVKSSNAGLNALQIIITVIAGLVGAGAILVAAIVMGGQRAAITKSLNLGNKFALEQDYDSAIASFKDVLEIDSNNADAVEGILQTEYTKGDYDQLADDLQQYYGVLVADQDGVSEELIDMAVAAKDGFDSGEEYINFIKELKKADDSDDTQKLCDDALLSVITDYISAGDYDKASEILEKIVAGDEDATISDIWIKILEKCAEEAWKVRDFEKAYEFLQFAFEQSEEDDAIKRDLLIVTENYVLDLKNRQKYDEALELIAWLQGIRGDDSLADISADINAMKNADADIQPLIEELNAAFDANNIERIEQLMNNAEFRHVADRIRGVLFSSSIRDSENRTGHGTAIYNVWGSAYVYYGDFVNGIRNGRGLWYFSDNENHLTKYDLIWENGLPNGAATCENYSTLTTHDVGGRVINSRTTLEVNTFNVVNGVYEGEVISHSKTLTGEYEEFTLEFYAENGIYRRIEVGDYPSDINLYQSTPGPIAGYVTLDSYYGEWYGIWQDWSPHRHTVDGAIVNTMTREVSSGDIYLE